MFKLTLLFFLIACASPTNQTRNLLRYPLGLALFNKSLYFSEYHKDEINILVHNEKREFWKQDGCGPKGIALFKDHWIVACYKTRKLIVLDLKGKKIQRGWNQFGEIEFIEGPNDFYSSKLGLYISTEEGQILFFDGRKITEVAANLMSPKGLSIIDNKLFVAENKKNRIIEFSIDEDGLLSNQKVFAKLPGNQKLVGPYGIFAHKNHLFVTHHSAGKVLRLTEAGKISQEYPLDNLYPTNIVIDESDMWVSSIKDITKEPFLGSLTKIELVD